MLLTISHMAMKNLLLVPGFYIPHLDLWGNYFLNFMPVSIFSTHLSQINPGFWKILNSVSNGKPRNEDHMMESKCCVDFP